jgi:tetratricopeptide (TPR) repeat protein
MKSPGREIYWALAVLCLALVIRIYHQHTLYGDPVRTALAPDEQAYEILADQGTAPPNASPGYFLNPILPIVISAADIFSHKPLAAVRWLNAVLGSLSCLFIFLLSRRYVSLWGSLFMAGVIAFYGPLIFLEGKILATNIAVFLVTLSLYLYQTAREKNGLNNGIVGGLAMGTALWARPNLLFVWPFLWLDPLIRDRNRRKIVIGFQSAFLVMFLLMSVRNSFLAGDLIIGTGSAGVNFYLGNHEGSIGGYTPVEGVSDNPMYSASEFKAKAENLTGKEMTFAGSDRFWLKAGLKYLTEDIGRAVRLWLRKIYLIVTPVEIPQNISYSAEKTDYPLLKLPLFTYIILFPLGATGMIMALRKWREYYPLYALLFGYSLSLIVLFVTGRYRMLLVPSLAVFGAVCIDRIIHTTRRDLAGRGWIWIALPLAIAAVLYATQPRANPDFEKAWLWYNRGSYFESAGKENLALYAYRKSLSYNVEFPRTVDSYNNLGIMLLKNGRIEEGKKYLLEAIALNPRNFRAHLNLGNAFFIQQQYGAALDHYKEALSIRNNYAYAWRNLGLSYNKLDSLDAAVNAFENAVRLNPGDSVSIKMIERLRNGTDSIK